MLPCPGNVAGGAKRHPTTCRDMEALFSSFHVGDVGVGVVGGYSGRRFGRLVMSWTCGASDVGVVLPELRNKKSPVNQCLQGVGDDVEVVGGWCSRWLGSLGVSWTWRVVWSVFVARVHENLKKTL